MLPSAARSATRGDPYDGAMARRGFIGGAVTAIAPSSTSRRPRSLHMRARGATRSSAASSTYSPKVFIPLTKLCRDRCGYCTFAQAPAHVASPYMASTR